MDSGSTPDSSTKNIVMIENKNAKEILSILKNTLLDILYRVDNSYGNTKDFLYFIEEDAIYDIKNLNLNINTEMYYIKKVIDIFGPYSETNQLYGIEDPYYGDFYFKK